MKMGEQQKSGQAVLVWDVPTRVFHWLLVTAFVMAWLSYEDNRYLDVHTFAGYTFLGLLIFRLIWGVFGTHYARFREFSYGFSDLFGYVKGLFGEDMRRYIGHNPAGAWAIFALIGLGLLLTISGLFVLGGEERHGPLAGIISFRQSVPFRETHEFAAYTLLLLVIIHFCGVIAESFLHRENLVGSMFRGTKRVDTESASVRPHHLIGATIITVVIAYVIATFGGYLTATREKPYLPFKGAQLVMNDLWNKSCSECHLAFHPGLLPIRSWARLMVQQSDHFGEDLALDEATITELLVYARENSADLEWSEAAWRMNSNISATETPLRITEVRYWKRKHKEMGDEIWQRKEIKSKANCGACHLDAKQGAFEDANMRIPGESLKFDAIEWLKSVLGNNVKVSGTVN